MRVCNAHKKNAAKSCFPYGEAAYVFVMHAKQSAPNLAFSINRIIKVS